MKLFKRFGLSLSLAAALLSSFAPISAAAATLGPAEAPSLASALVPLASGAAENGGDAGSEDEASWPNNIEALLEAGECEENEAIATVTPDIKTTLDGKDGCTDVSYEPLYDAEGDAFESATGMTLPAEALAGARDGDETVGADDVEIRMVLVSSPSRTTRELLELLAQDPRVLDATPNYVCAAIDDELTGGVAAALPDAAGEGAELAGGTDGSVDAASADDADAAAALQARALAASGSDAAVRSAAFAKDGSFAPAAAQDVTAIADATSLQWAYNRTDSASTYHGERSLSAALSAFAWNGGVNAGGIVAVVDTGVDFTHPDLAPVMADMSPYVAAAGGTARGFNAARQSADPRDDFGHGTHVAGIIAAATNGAGVSGAANGVKILPVKVSDSQGRFSLANITRGYKYLKEAVEAGADIRVVNNSWSGRFECAALETSVFDLGKLGAVSVFAAGNNSTDVDTTIPKYLDEATDGGGSADAEAGAASAKAAKGPLPYSACMFRFNPYAITVDSLDMDGSASSFTNYGRLCTDVFAPGDTIFSTTRSDRPGKYVASALRAYSSTFATFDGGADGVTAQNDRGDSLGSLDSGAGFDDVGGCLSLSGQELAGAATVDSSTTAAERIILRVPVDESKLSQVSMVGCAISLKGAGSSEVWLEVLDSKGRFVGGSTEREVALDGRWITPSLDLYRATTARKRQVALYRDASNRAYITVALCIKNATDAARSSLKIDCVGVGDASWHYGFMSGTSMATPAVSGLAAVMTDKIPAYTSLPQAVRAMKVATLILDSASKRDNLDGLCWTGGVVDPSAFDGAIAEDRNPYVVDVSFGDGPDGKSTLLIATGMGFGTREDSTLFASIGSMGVGYEVLTWTDTKIVIKIDSKFENAEKIEVKVSNSDGVTSEGVASSVMSGGSGGGDPTDPVDPDDPAGPGTPEGPGAPTDPDAPDEPGSTGGSKGDAKDAATAASATASAKKEGKAALRLANTGDRAIVLVGGLLVVGAAALTVGVAMYRHRR